MSPLTVEILLWHYSRAGQFLNWRDGSAQMDIRAWLLAMGLLGPSPYNSDDLVITERGRVLVDAILATPLPEQKWVMP